MDQVYIRARDLALRWGMKDTTKTSTDEKKRRTNHTQFLQRIADKHEDDPFPTALRLGGRTVYRLDEVETFERILPKRRAA